MTDIAKVGVVGAGLMGHGIAQVSAEAGYDVILLDADGAALERGLDVVRGQVGRAVEKGRRTQEEADAVLGRLRGATTVTRKTTEQGAATSVLLAASPLLDGVGGRYFVDCNEAEPVTKRTGTLNGVATYALDTENADRLWERSVKLLA